MCFRWYSYGSGGIVTQASLVSSATMPSMSPCSPASANRTVIVVHDSGRLYPEGIIFTTTAPEKRGEK
jgi:hypothetical protein